MRSYSLTLVVAAAAAYLQYAVLPRLITVDFTPDLALATVVYVALAAGGVGAVVFGFALGLAGDLLGWGPVGVSALVATVAAAVTGRLRVHLYEYSLLVPVILAAVAALLKQLLAFVLVALGPAPVAFGWSVLGHLLLAGATTGLAGFPLFFLYWRLIPPRRR
jgi:rod shape-determining protein MreD